MLDGDNASTKKIMHRKKYVISETKRFKVTDKTRSWKQRRKKLKWLASFSQAASFFLLMSASGKLFLPFLPSFAPPFPFYNLRPSHSLSYKTTDTFFSFPRESSLPDIYIFFSLRFFSVSYSVLLVRRLSQKKKKRPSFFHLLC